MLVEKSTNVVWQDTDIDKERRNKLNNHKSAILWFTGLSGSGKSTIANDLEKVLHKLAIRTFILDGDNIRHGLNKDLGFSNDDRKENIRRIGEVAKLFVESGTMTLTTFISPFIAERDVIRDLMPENDFIEIYVQCPLTVCEERDIKGLYKKARRGEIKDFTGIDSPYEPPEKPDITVDTSTMSIEKCVNLILHHMIQKELIYCRRDSDKELLHQNNYYKYIRQ